MSFTYGEVAWAISDDFSGSVSGGQSDLGVGGEVRLKLHDPFHCRTNVRSHSVF